MVVNELDAAGAFAAMALLGRLDQVVASRGLSFTIAPLGAVCAVLFTNPNAPAAQVRTPLALAQSLMLQIVGIQQSSMLLEEVEPTWLKTNSFGSHDHEWNLLLNFQHVLWRNTMNWITNE